MSATSRQWVLSLCLPLSLYTGIPAMVAMPQWFVNTQQIPLIHIVETDDLALAQCPDADWFRILHEFPWQDYCGLGARYYEALFSFNGKAQAQRQERQQGRRPPNPESKDQARERFLFQRPTAGNAETPILFTPLAPPEPVRIRPQDLAPGRVPRRLAGRQAKCFFSLFKSFLGMSFMGRRPEPEEVHDHLVNNPAFARACGWTVPDLGGPYRQSDVPSLRKLQQFDQIMTDNGLWSQQKWEQVHRNVEEGYIEPEPEVVHDTTHYEAHSSFEVVGYQDHKDKTQKKSQSKPRKSCACADKESCPHEWVLTDEGAGTVVKSCTKMYWAHKASILALPRQEIPLDAVAVQDAATHDGRTLVPHLGRLYDNLPEVSGWFKYVLDDGAAYDADLRRVVQDEFGLTLRASINPRRQATISEGLPRGMAKLTPYGSLVCQAGHELEFLGARKASEHFLYGPPVDDQRVPECEQCACRTECCPRADTGRHVAIAFDRLPHIFPDDPAMAKRYGKMMARRPAVERVIKRLKQDLGDDRLSKRGNASFQARLDKTLLAFHILLRL